VALISCQSILIWSILRARRLFLRCSTCSDSIALHSKLELGFGFHLLHDDKSAAAVENNK
jgi:hypothetical protein